MVVMNHKTKQCNCLESNDKLGFFDDLTKAHLYEIWFVKFVHHHLQMLLPYIVYHLNCLCGLELLLFAQIYFTKDMIQEKVNFLKSPLFKNIKHSCCFLFLFFAYSHAFVYDLHIMKNREPFPFLVVLFSCFIRALTILVRCVVCFLLVARLCYSSFSLSQAKNLFDEAQLHRY